MWYTDWGNCQFHTEIHFFTPNQVLVNTDKGDITVLMVNKALDYILRKIALKNPMGNTYKRAKIVFLALKRRFANQTPLRYSKEDIKNAIDVLAEISKEMARSNMEREGISECTSICKLMIDGFCNR